MGQPLAGSAEEMFPFLYDAEDPSANCGVIRRNSVVVGTKVQMYDQEARHSVGWGLSPRLRYMKGVRGLCGGGAPGPGGLDRNFWQF